VPTPGRFLEIQRSADAILMDAASGKGGSGRGLLTWHRREGAVTLDAHVALGYDGSDPSRLALRWAAAARASLRIIHAWIWPLFTHDVGPVLAIAEGTEHTRGTAARAASPSSGVPKQGVVVRAMEE
jgi:hypothetical protein